jgi:hypothetical protein
MLGVALEGVQLFNRASAKKKKEPLNILFFSGLTFY